MNIELNEVDALLILAAAALNYPQNFHVSGMQTIGIKKSYDLSAKLDRVIRDKFGKNPPQLVSAAVEFLKGDQGGEESIRLRAFNGDYAKNLESLADEYEKFFKEQEDQTHALAGAYLKNLHRLKGYSEQLRIIADEIRKTNGSLIHVRDKARRVIELLNSKASSLAIDSAAIRLNKAIKESEGIVPPQGLQTTLEKR